ncbi:MAG: heat-inducible transcriptional repressor HrcA [Bacilli bacterium]
MLTERQKLILRAIIDDYIRYAEPLGSRTISKREDVTYSPATIRNEMSDLEQLGYLEQPHTSAGRIPSQKGYRFYVDHLLNPFTISAQDSLQIRDKMTERMNEREQVIQQTASILSSLTNYTAIVLGPEVFESTLKHVQIIPLSDQSAVAIFVTNTGHVENRNISIPPDVSVHEIEQMVHILNAKLVGVPLYQMRHRIYSEVADELRRHVDHYEKTMVMLEQLKGSNKREDRVYFGGTTNMLSQPEFRDVDKVKGILDLFEHQDVMIQLIGSHNEGLSVKIGQENDVQAIQNCSVITASYSVDGKPVGTIGLLGPTRMEYQRVMSILDFLSRDLSLLLSQSFKK